MRTAAVILAAGGSSRFGSPKQLADVGGRTMLERVVKIASGAGLQPIVAVVPAWLAMPAGATPVVNDDPATGLSRSLRMGVAAVPTYADAAVILLGDQPTVPVSHIQELMERAGSSAASVVATRAEGRIGPPVLLRRAAFGLVEEVSGDEGLARVLVAHAELVSFVDVARHPPDVDTPADLSALIEADRAISDG